MATNKNGRTAFTPHNNLQSTKLPTFETRRGKNIAAETSTSRTKDLDSAEFSTLLPSFDSPESVVKRLSDIGDSSSLFSYDTPSSFIFGGETTKDGRSPVPFIFGNSNASKEADSNTEFARKDHSFDFGGVNTRIARNSSTPFVFGSTSNDSKDKKLRSKESKMVNERAPAKAVPRPVSRDSDDGAPAPKFNYASGLGEAPRFGQTSLPQSPLVRKPKESSMFIQPKSRPEHHRDQPRPGGFSC